jgi:cytochrome c oxidase subunit 5a
MDDFISRWSGHFNSASDLFELQRGLNNCFGYDLVPPVPVIKTALTAARRLNDFPTAVRILAALKFKTENEKQYKIYVDALAPEINNLGLLEPEKLFNRNI